MSFPSANRTTLNLFLTALLPFQNHTNKKPNRSYCFRENGVQTNLVYVPYPYFKISLFSSKMLSSPHLPKACMCKFSPNSNHYFTTLNKE